MLKEGINSNSNKSKSDVAKKILFLVAGENQLPVIEYANENGYYVITCDNNPSNPGHLIADENIYLDTYDKKAVYNAIKEKRIHAIVNFISEHGLITSAYISEKMALPGLKTAELLQLMDKGKFRNFLRENSFDVPKNIVSKEFDEGLDKGMRYPLIVKPVDRGGSLGISKVSRSENLRMAFELAKSHSNSGEVIIEEFIYGHGALNGDFILVNNKVIFHLIGDYWYENGGNPVLPFATTFPSKLNITDLLIQLERLLNILDIKNGVFNFEAILTGNTIYFIEINPRHSGNLIYKLMEEATGRNFPAVTVEMACGKEFEIQDFNKRESFLAYCLIYSKNSGILDRIEISPALKTYLLNKEFFKKPGEKIKSFETLYDRIGLLHLKFSNQREMDRIIEQIEDFYKVILK